ncbi:NAD(P)-binding protein [Xylariaceae sp. FL0255]|nr:NAD(P)-binding protein [Xylariaceae sp. FL0255]
MDLTALPPSRARLAAQIENLPLELVAPILRDLPLCSVLELASSSSSGPRLIAAIHTDPYWKHLFQDNYDDLKQIWFSLNSLSWLHYRLPWKDKYTYERRKYPSCSNPCAWVKGQNKKDIPVENRKTIRNLESHVYELFSLLLGPKVARGWSLSIRPRIPSPEFRALCCFLPINAPFDAAILNATAVDFDSTPLYAITKTSSQDLSRDEWANLHRLIHLLCPAYESMTQAQAAQLERLADLYDRYPAFLKVAFAPQSPVSNRQHIAHALRHDARLVMRRPMKSVPGLEVDTTFNVVTWEPTGLIYRKNTWYRFRFPHPGLIPFDWCIQLFQTIVHREGKEDLELKLPSRLAAYFKKAVEGLGYIYSHFSEIPIPRITTKTPVEAVTFIGHASSAEVLPKPEEEMEWLESFLHIVGWMVTEHPDLARSVMSDHGNILRRRLLIDSSDHEQFVAHESPRVVARQIRIDLAQCNGESSPHLPSLLALYLPPWGSSRAREIAACLLPRSKHLSDELLRLGYEGRIEKIIQHLHKVPNVEKKRDNQELIAERVARLKLEGANSQSNRPPRPSLAELNIRQGLTKDEMASVMKALKLVMSSTDGEADESLVQVMRLMEKASTPEEDGEGSRTPAAASWNESVDDYVAYQQDRGRRRTCYICYRSIPTSSPAAVASMCIPCANFNLAGSQLSLPPRLSLEGFVAVVTGARINLGYHVTLRLLRCGAKVIASSRYPRDALSRYENEKDSKVWLSRLRIVGADFRTAKDAFQLVQTIRPIVAEWGGRLHILINNAAQTLTDSIKKEESAVKREHLLQGSMQQSLSLPSTQYTPQARAGNQIFLESSTTAQHDARIAGDTRASPGQTDIQEPQQESSWVQSISNIPYEDVITAQSVNAFVPLILIRELLPLMATTEQSPGNPPSTESSNTYANKAKAMGYIVNVSSREGIIEYAQTKGRAGSAKNARHVHTNMSKAALNMITETEAGDAWEMHRVAMNTVDPGYMSAAPEFEAAHGGVRPIGWEDGAGRVLWPIAVGVLSEAGEKGCNVVWGRFLKHYGAVRASFY